MYKLFLGVNYTCMTKSQFANRLKELRIATGISQTKLCESTSIGSTLYELYESENHSHMPTYKRLIALANIFECSIDYLLCQTDNPKRNN